MPGRGRAQLQRGRAAVKFPVAALFVDPRGPYPDLAAEWFDEARDARSFEGGLPVVAHPPCRAWSRLRAMAKPLPGERELAFYALDAVRRCGGVLEHPSGSLLWRVAGLPQGTTRDHHGGWTLVVDQNWWGHRARKRTLLYFVGVEPSRLPSIPLDLREPPCTVGLFSGRDRARARPELSKPERHLSPPAFARWLCQAVAA